MRRCCGVVYLGYSVLAWTPESPKPGALGPGKQAGVPQGCGAVPRPQRGKEKTLLGGFGGGLAVGCRQIYLRQTFFLLEFHPPSKSGPEPLICIAAAAQSRKGVGSSAVQNSRYYL